MGMCASFLHTRERDELRVAMEATMRVTLIDEPHFWRLYLQFKRANRAHNNQLLLEELVEYLDVDCTPFMRRLYGLYKDDSDSIGFKHFALFTWNFCSSDNETLPLFAFSVHDRNRNGVMNVEEVATMMTEVYGEGYRERAGPRALEASLCDLDLAGNPVAAAVTPERFITAAVNAPSVLADAFHLQAALRRRFLGEAFWDKLSLRRDAAIAARSFTIASVVAVINEGRELERQYKAFGDSHFVSLTRADVAAAQRAAASAAASALTSPLPPADPAAGSGVTLVASPPGAALDPATNAAVAAAVGVALGALSTATGGNPARVVPL